MDQATGAALAVRTLMALGVRHVFGVPGGQTLAFMNAMLDHPDMTFILTRHEGAAAVMADAYGRLTGVPAVALATTGPGATNLLTGIGGALRDSSPLIVITCNNNSADLGKDDAQNADHIALFRPLTKQSRLVVRPEAVIQALEEAYVGAVTGNPGPTHVDFSRDSLEGTVSGEPLIRDPHPARLWTRQRPEPDPEVVAQIAARIGAATRPVLWLGSGATRSSAGMTAIELAETISAPIITTFNGIGSVPTSHPLVFGAHSRMGTSLSNQVLADCDLVVAVGNGLNAVSTSRWRLPLPEIIQIDIEPANLARYYGGQTIALIGDAQVALRRILERIREQPDRNDGEQRDWIERLAAARAQWWSSVSAISDPPSLPANGALSPAEAVTRLRRAAPDETLLIADAGNPGVWSHLWEIRQTGSYIKPVGFGNMGFAVPAAIAAALVKPDRPVLALVGDGALGMSLAELETLSRVGGRVCVVVLNDAGYGNIRQEQEDVYGYPRMGVDFSDSDYSQVARALGLEARRIVDLDDLEREAREALERSNRPVLFDVPIDRSVSAWSYWAFQPEVPEPVT